MPRFGLGTGVGRATTPGGGGGTPFSWSSGPNGSNGATYTFAGTLASLTVRMYSQSGDGSAGSNVVGGDGGGGGGYGEWVLTAGQIAAINAESPHSIGVLIDDYCIWSIEKDPPAGAIAAGSVERGWDSIEGGAGSSGAGDGGAIVECIPTFSASGGAGASSPGSQGGGGGGAGGPNGNGAAASEGTGGAGGQDGGGGNGGDGGVQDDVGANGNPYGGGGGGGGQELMISGTPGGTGGAWLVEIEGTYA